MARLTTYNNEIATEICDVIAENMLSLKTLCKKYPHWPRPRTIRTWVRENKEFQHMYALAKEDQSDLMAEEVLEICDDNSNDYVQNDEGKLVYNAEHVNRARLRVDTRKWVACKLKPKVYGDKVHHDVNASLHEDSLKNLA